VTFNEAVTVTGVPQIQLETGSVDRVATYAGGSGTVTLSFTYTVQAGDTSADLDYLSTTALTLNGGTIKDAAGNAATLTLPSPGAANSLGANKAIVIDTTVPTISSGTLAASNVYIDIVFSEGVYGDAAATTPVAVADFTLTFVANGGGAAPAPTIAFVKKNDYPTSGDASALVGGETTIRVFLTAFTTQPSGVETIEIKPADTGAVSVYDRAGNPAAITQTTGVKTLNDKLQPTVTANDITTVDGAYKTGDIIYIKITYSEAVTVTGTPTLALNTAPARSAVYNSGTGTVDIIFKYTVSAGDASSDLGATNVNAISLSGGTIKDAAGNDAVNTLVNDMTAANAVVIDMTAPTVVVSDADATTGARRVKSGDAVAITATFTEANGMDETPVPAITIGTIVNGAAMSKTSNLVWTYAWTVPAGNEGTHTVSITATDAAGNPNAAATGRTSYIIDNTAPTITSGTVGASNLYIDVVFSEGVYGAADGATPVAADGSDLALTFVQNGGPATGVAIASVKKADSVLQASATALAGGETTVRVFLTVTGTPNGAETIEVKSAAAGPVVSVYDKAGNPALVTQTTGVKHLSATTDTTKPVISSGTVGAGNVYMDIVFSEGVYGAADATTPLLSSKLTLTFVKGATGTATNVVISSVKKNNGATEGTASVLTGGETTVRVFLTVTGTPNGVETIEIKPTDATSVYDNSGNAALATTTTGAKNMATSATDTTAPTLTITTVPASPSSTKTSLVYTFTFSEAVTGFTSADITLAFAGAAAGAVDGSTFATTSTSVYTLTLAGQDLTDLGALTSGQTVVASVAMAGLTDLASNAGVGTTTNTWTYSTAADTTAPTVTITQKTTQADPVKTGPILFTVVFSESVTGFATGDVTLSGTAGATTATVTGSGTTYEVSVTGMTGTGTVIATIAAGKATDAASNANVASTSTDNTVTYDITAPTITLGTLGANNVYIDVVFSEGVYGAADGTTAPTAANLLLTFTANGGSATAASISSVKKNDGTTALAGGETTIRVFLTVTGVPSGVETVEIKPASAASVYDKAGNAALATTTTGAKTLGTTTTDAPTSTDGPIVNAAEKAAGVHITVGLGTSGAAAGNTLDILLGGASFPTAQTHVLTAAEITAGTYTFIVPSGVWGADGAKSITARVNAGTASAALALTFDTTAPTAAVTYSKATAKSGESLIINVTFSEAMVDSPAPNIAISGANTLAAVAMTKIDATHYTYTHKVVDASGTATVSLSIGTDAAGNVVTSTPTSGATFKVEKKSIPGPGLMGVIMAGAIVLAIVSMNKARKAKGKK
ncbi:MAG: Ig-like domain-containing protein, partial [Candidatus Thermoplasmatota archaeon]|nr:Ig-like domain-containing protein [Candidatus Thermoplasmatota archaeon]